MMDEKERKEKLEQKYQIELNQVPGENVYRLSTHGIQKVFTGLPMVFTLDQIDELIPQLDLLVPYWRD